MMVQELLQSVEETRAGKMAAFGEREAHFTELVDQARKVCETDMKLILLTNVDMFCTYLSLVNTSPS